MKLKISTATKLVRIWLFITRLVAIRILGRRLFSFVQIAYSKIVFITDVKRFVVICSIGFLIGKKKQVFRMKLKILLVTKLVGARLLITCLVAILISGRLQSFVQIA